MIRSRQLSLLLGSLLLGGLIATGCDVSEIIEGGGGEEGSGTLVTETRDVAVFTEVEVGTAITLDIIVNPDVETSVFVIFDDNLLDNLVTRVAGGKLIVELDGSVNLTGSADRRVEVTMPNLESLDASGATDVTVVGWSVQWVSEYIRIDASGASRVDLEDLKVRDVDVDASGASDVILNVEGVVSGSASGASKVTVRGNPTSVLIESSGASSIDLP
ncbi:MAG: hypothetical protein GY722_17135 [bacterium]|nr:hypothetical protein [bacterium]